MSGTSNARVGPGTGPATTVGVVLVDDLAAKELSDFLQSRLFGFALCVAVGIGAKTLYDVTQRRRQTSATRDPSTANARYFALRLTPGTEIKSAVNEFVKANNIRAGAVVSVVGSTLTATIRLANASASEAGTLLETSSKCEIVSLSGTVGVEGMHLHVALGDEKGAVVGGHLVRATVNTTCELVIVDLSGGLDFTREMDQTTGFKELKVRAW